MQIDKKQLSSALIEAMDKEELHTSECARLLNVKPCYISMARSEKSWDAMGRAPWIRIEEWLNTRAPLKEFVIPKDEPITIRKIETKSQEPAQMLSEVKEIKTRKTRKVNGEKSVKVILFQGELEKLNNRIEELNLLVTKLMGDNNTLAVKLHETEEKLWVLEDETIPVMSQRIKELENKAVPLRAQEDHQATSLKSGGIVIFQRNIYPKP